MINQRNQLTYTNGAKRVVNRKGFSRRRSQVLIASSCLCVTIVLLALTANNTFRWISRVSSAGQQQFSDANNVRMGSIQLQTDRDQCDLMEFDNDTGHVVSYSQQCHSSVTLDAHGAPVPTGTIRRLDLIRKSFREDGQ